MVMKSRIISGGLLLLSALTCNAASETDQQLIEAARNLDTASVQALVKQKKIDVNATQGDGTTALAWAVYRDNPELVNLLIRSGADVNVANDLGVTPLHLACENRNAEIVSALLKAGADPNKTLWSGETPLMNAAATGMPEIATALLDHGADINVQDPRRNQSALMWAIAFGHPEVARILIERGADINARTIKLKEKNDYQPMVMEGYAATVESVAQGGYTPLMFAARSGDMDTSRLLIEKGANVNDVSVEDGSALVIASAGGFEELALYLLEKGADPKTADANGLTALHYAMRDGMKLLHGYPLDSVQKVCGFGPLRLCKPLESLSAEEQSRVNEPGSGLFLEDKTNGVHDPKAVLPGDNMYELAEALLAKGADPNAPLKYPPARLRLDSLPWLNLTGATPFFLAAAAMDTTAMDMLLEHNARPQVTTEINNAVFEKQMKVYADDNQILGNGTALMVAVGLGKKNEFTPSEEKKALDATSRLISLGADVNAATATGWTALHAASFLGADSLVKLLVEKGARVNVQNGCGQTPLSLAEGKNLAGMINRPKPRPSTHKLLIELGADPAKVSAPAGQCILGRGGLEAELEIKKEVKASESQ